MIYSNEEVLCQAAEGKAKIWNSRIHMRCGEIAVTIYKKTPLCKTHRNELLKSIFEDNQDVLWYLSEGGTLRK